MNTLSDDMTVYCAIDQETIQNLKNNFQMVIQQYLVRTSDKSSLPLVSGCHSLLDGDLKGAEMEFRKAVISTPSLADGYYFIGFTKRVRHEFKLAAFFFHECLKLNHAHLQALEERSVIRLATGDLAGALKDYQHLIKLQPDCPKWYIVRAKIYSALGKSDKAVDDLKAVFSLNADLIDRQFRMEILQLSTKNSHCTLPLAASEQAFRANFSEAYLQTGLNRQRKMDVKGAVEYYERAIALDPNNSGAYFLRGEIKFKLKDLEGALEDLTLSLRHQPNLPDAHFLRGTVLWKLGAAAEAIQEFDQAIELNSCDGKVYYARGLAYLDMNNESAGHKDMIIANELGFSETLQTPWSSFNKS